MRCVAGRCRSLVSVASALVLQALQRGLLLLPLLVLPLALLFALVATLVITLLVALLLLLILEQCAQTLDDLFLCITPEVVLRQDFIGLWLRDDAGTD